MVGIDNRKDLLLLLLYMPGESRELCEPVSGRTRLMKLLFLMEHEKLLPEKLGIGNWYKFEPFHFGPFTHEVFDDIDFLQNVGLIESRPEKVQSLAESEETERVMEESGEDRIVSDLESEQLGGPALDPLVDVELYALTSKGRRFVEQRLLQSLDPTTRDAIEALKTREGSLSLSSLLKYVYRKYPRYAVRSQLDHLRP